MKWATRMAIDIDPAACAWLIRHAIDPDAEFVFLSEPADLPADATPFDLPGAELSGRTGPDGTDCAFETILRHYELFDPTLWRIAEVVHEAELLDERYYAPEARGLARARQQPEPGRQRRAHAHHHQAALRRALPALLLPGHSRPATRQLHLIHYGLSVGCGMLAAMTPSDPKADLRRYLQTGPATRCSGSSTGSPSTTSAARWCRPAPTCWGWSSTSASVEPGYFGETFGRPFGEPLPWLDEDAEPNADMWATADESREQIVGLYRRAWAHADATIDALDLDDDRRRCRGGRRSGSEVDPAPDPRPHDRRDRTGTPGTPTSSASSSTGRRAFVPSTRTCRTATRTGGRPTATGSSGRRGRLRVRSRNTPMVAGRAG